MSQQPPVPDFYAPARPLASPPPGPAGSTPPFGVGAWQPAQNRTNGLAIAAFVLSILSVVLVSVVLAVVALGQIRSRGEGGRGLAIASLVISGVWVLVIGVGAAVTLVSAADRDAAGSVVESGDVSVFEIQVGDCFDEPVGEVVNGVLAVPCAEPHFAEAFAQFELAAEQYPGDEQVFLEAEAGCVDRFGAFVGREYAESVYDVFYFHPTASSWHLDDRTVLCAVFDPAGQTSVPTLRGAQG